MKDVSIEYAHIYTNNKIAQEQKFSLEVLTELKSNFESDGKTTSLVVLVDDYSFPDPSFDYNIFTSWLSEKGFKPDVVLRESQLIPVCDEVLNIMENKKLKESISDYIRTKKKYPCSLFVAAWYLLRLGYLSHDIFNKEFIANKLVNVLPASFKPFEDKALEILETTPYSKSLEQIEHKYFEGRIVL